MFWSPHVCVPDRVGLGYQGAPSRSLVWLQKRLVKYREELDHMPNKEDPFASTQYSCRNPYVRLKGNTPHKTILQATGEVEVEVEQEC